MAEAGITVTYTDRGLKELMENLRELGKLRVTVGYQGREATKTLKPGGATTGFIAKVNEFGTKNIPARPFMRNAVKESGQDIAETAADVIGPVALGKDDPVDAMAEIGEVIQKAVLTKLRTTRTWAKPNAASTIAQKGFGLPPLDAGHQRLEDGLTWAVRDGRTVIREGK